MKTEQKEQAKEMYFQDGMSKTAIANKLGVARKTVLFWASQGNWDNLKRSAQNTPALVAEKCYYLIDQYASRMLTDGVGIAAFSLKDAQTIHLLASAIKKIRTRSTTNESMEMFQFFFDGLNRRNPALAEQVKPEIEEYINIRSNTVVTDFLLDGFNPDGTLPYPDEPMVENHLDKQDYQALENDFQMFMESRNTTNQNTTAGGTTPNGQPAPGETQAGRTAA